MPKVKHLILSPVDYTTCSTDNNCVSILIDYGQNVKPDCGGAIIDRDRMILSERYMSQKQFTALKSKESFYSVLKFKTGAVIVVGLKETDLTNLCVVKAVAAISDTLEYPIWIDSVSVVNRVSTFNRFNLNFHAIRLFFRRHCLAHNYIPETFPGMFFKIQVPRDMSRGIEHLGAYYMQAALECRSAKNEEERNRIMKEKFIVKRVLVFKIGKHTILGKSARDDVSLEARLMFGFFHYFMDKSIKMTKKEILEIRKKYSIPPLECFLSIDLFFHDHAYEPPRLDDIRKALLGDTDRRSIDSVQYGSEKGGDNIEAIMSNNILPSTRETLAAFDVLSHQKITANHDPQDIARAAMAENAFEPRESDCWWVNPPRRRRNDNAAAPLVYTMDKTSISRNSEWLRSEHGHFYDEICSLVRTELKEKTILAGYLEDTTSYTPRNSFHGNRNDASNKIRRNNRVKTARLDTQYEVFKFINKEITSGNAHNIAKLLGTDVYSVVNMMGTLPHSTGHQAALLKNYGDDYNITPGVAFFNRVLDRSTTYKRKRMIDDDGEATEASNEEEEASKKRITSDFIKDITAFEDDDVEKIGLNINMASIIETLNKDDIFMPNERPTANYRTSLHASSQTKSILRRLVDSLLVNADGMTEEEELLARAAIESGNKTSSSTYHRDDSKDLVSLSKLTLEGRSSGCTHCNCGDGNDQ
ncbi:hypothetical protein Pcinc_020699 [Petrolisthes cinctipes]|uniref:Uncharacterized protein n=1 Tax=Petrolisthes cinctipes TaxID=88211 RepID=A0AAE1KIU3_PETCI|nr:hypothetical protein Pcinc_020699 [Petrolisthes cinctipes]